MERISPTSDLAFKKALASEGNKDILAGLIKDFYSFEVMEEDLILEHPYSIDVYREYVEGKEVSVLRHTAKDVAASFDPLKDVLASLKRADFISEVQVKKTKYFAERFLYYPFERFCQNYSKAGFIKVGSDGSSRRFSSLRPVYALNILGESHFRDDDALRIFEMYDPHRQKSYPKELIRVGFFELTKLNVETYNQKHWQDYFKTGIANPDAPCYIKKASEIIDWMNLTQEEREMALALEKAQAIRDEEIFTALEETREETREEIAKNMLEEGLPPGVVAKCTGLPLDIVKAM